MPPSLRHISLAAIFMAPLLAWGADDCVRSQPAPVFDARQPGLRSHRFVPVSSHEATERMTLASGESVDVKLGGCEYFVATFRFSARQLLRQGASRQEIYKVAAMLLLKLGQLKGESGFDLGLAAKTLISEGGKNPAPEFEQPFAVDGDGIDFLQTQVQVDAAGQKAGAGFVQVSLFRGPL